MPVFIGSRYAGQPVYLVVNSDGVYNSTVYGPAPLEQGAFYYYTVVLGDRFDLLAYKYYNDSSLWWRLADANPEVIYPDISLVPGTVIRIPVS